MGLATDIGLCTVLANEEYQLTWWNVFKIIKQYYVEKTVFTMWSTILSRRLEKIRPLA
jgi:hypothetical protein